MPETPSHRVYIPEVIDPDESMPPDLLTLRKFADLMDRAVPIPGTSQRVGFDAAAGLIPGVGDIVTGAMSAWIIVSAVRHRVPLPKIFRMFVNLLVDLIVGAVPLFGDVFDVFHKQNVMNMRILLDHRNRQLPPRKKRDVVGAAAVVIIIVSIMALGAMIAAIAAIYWIAQQRYS
ncbi:MAG: DUF4112 domain-containing protein [Thermoanaerobaculia bacterium]